MSSRCCMESVWMSFPENSVPSSENPVPGFYFKYGATGICPVGNGLFYFAEPGKNAAGKQYSRTHLYRWTGDSAKPFDRL